MLAAAPEVEIGAHTETHPDLTAIGREQIAEEFLECKRKLEDATGRLIEVAAYPYGRATDEAVSACSAAGFAAACLSGGRGSWLDAYRLPREDMDNRCTITGLRLKRTGRYEPLVATPPGAALRRAVRVFRSLGG
jgi:peptidoglycan/xylan/chitin deacetylase (PgdA/CDA1 family)